MSWMSREILEQKVAAPQIKITPKTNILEILHDNCMLDIRMYIMYTWSLFYNMELIFLGSNSYHTRVKYPNFSVSGALTLIGQNPSESKASRSQGVIVWFSFIDLSNTS